MGTLNGAGAGPPVPAVSGGGGRGGGEAAYRLRAVFDRIDHIGVAVQEIEPALELYRDRLALVVAHREVVRGAGRRGGASGRG